MSQHFYRNLSYFKMVTQLKKGNRIYCTTCSYGAFWSSCKYVAETHCQDLGDQIQNAVVVDTEELENNGGVILASSRIYWEKNPEEYWPLKSCYKPGNV